MLVSLRNRFFLSFLLLLTMISSWVVLAEPQSEPVLLVYCGTTMVRPIQEIATEFEKQHHVKVTIVKGGSEVLYKSLKASRKGDLFLPGEASYRNKNLADGLLGAFKMIGYNQAAIFVQKGNPKAVTADLSQLLRTDLRVVISTPESGSIGLETQSMLAQLGMYEQVLAFASQLLPDSRTLNNALKNDEADVSVNWRATAFFPDNQDSIEAIDLPESVAKPQSLLLNMLTFSQQPVLAHEFIDLAASAFGQSVMRKYGFLDNTIKQHEPL